jgi:glutathione S-transferase
MIDLYYWTTPNGHKITIFLEETRLPYRIKPVNISKGDQFTPDFLAISPNNRIPAIVDHDPARRRPSAADVRVGCDPALPRRQDRPFLS